MEEEGEGARVRLIKTSTSAIAPMSTWLQLVAVRQRPDDAAERGMSPQEAVGEGLHGRMGAAEARSSSQTAAQQQRCNLVLHSNGKRDSQQPQQLPRPAPYHAILPTPPIPYTHCSLLSHRYHLAGKT